ncbi:MAG: NfeD family protein [Candidatus Brocadiae bacterium]|nr:NfeD family protein [Candidatus Brocadiia bacterium]
METWIVWAMVAIFLAILELFLPGLTLISLSLGAVAASVAASFKAGMSVQMGIFCGASIVCFVALRPILLSLFYPKNGKHETNVQALIDKNGIVIEDIKDGNTHGWIKVSQEDWPAVSVKGNFIPKNTKVVVKGIEGNTLSVEEGV